MYVINRETYCIICISNKHLVSDYLFKVKQVTCQPQHCENKSHMVQELLTLSQHPSSSSVFSRVRFARSLVFFAMFRRLSFVLLSIVLSVLRFTASDWPLYCLSFDLRLLIGHCIVCPSITASDYPFDIIKRFFHL